MKKFLYVYLCVVLFSPIKANAQVQNPTSLEITGKITGLQPYDSLFLMYRATPRKNDTVASTAVSASGIFRLTAGLPHRGKLCYLSIKGKKDSTLFLLDDHMVLEGDTGSWPDVRVMSSAANDDFLIFKAKLIAKDTFFSNFFYHNPQLMYQYLINSATAAYVENKEDLFKTYLKQYNIYTKTLKDFIKQYPNSLVSPFLLSNTFLYKAINTCSEINEYYQMLTPYAKENSYYGSQLLIVANDKDICYDFGGALNSRAPEINMKDINGKSFSLYGLLKAKKLVLVDFWSSSCGVCRKNMPFYKQLLKEYGKSGLEIVAYAADKDEKKARNAIEKDKTEVFHHLLGATDWIKLNKAYSKRAGYITYLVDETGTIISDGFNNLELYQLINQKLR